MYVYTVRSSQRSIAVNGRATDRCDDRIVQTKQHSSTHFQLSSLSYSVHQTRLAARLRTDPLWELTAFRRPLDEFKTSKNGNEGEKMSLQCY